MGQRAEAAMDRWFDIVTGRTDKPPLEWYQIGVRGDRLFSYGSHFELARPLRDRKGEITGWLLNGERSTVTTTQHQAHVRQMVNRRHEPVVIIPHGALDSAGIDRDTIQIIHAKPDRFQRIDHCETQIPPRARWHSRPITERVRKSDAEIGALLTKKHKEAIDSWAYAKKAHQQAQADENAPEWRKNLWAKAAAEPMPTRPTVRVLRDYDLDKWVTVGMDTRLYSAPNGGGHEIEVVEQDDGSKTYEWTTHRHWLGESLIRARVTWRTSTPCQFCINGRVYGPAREYSWGSCDACSGMGSRTKNHHRWAYYLSGFDHEEARPLYFFCELPYRSKPTTVDEAYEVLKPDPVKMAEQMSRPVFRQGDIFGVPLDTVDRKTLKALGARVERRCRNNLPGKITHLPYVLGTNHTATEVAYLPNGVTLARGTMYHDPSFRNPDHARRRLGDGKTWHVVVKNTVPISGRR